MRQLAILTYFSRIFQSNMTRFPSCCEPALRIADRCNRRNDYSGEEVVGIFGSTNPIAWKHSDKAVIRYTLYNSIHVNSHGRLQLPRSSNSLDTHDAHAKHTHALISNIRILPARSDDGSPTSAGRYTAATPTYVEKSSASRQKCASYL